MEQFATAATAPLQKLTQFALTIGLILVIAMVVYFVASWLWRRAARSRMLRSGSLPDSELENYRTYLVEAVGEASRTQGRPVRLRGAWKALEHLRGSPLTAAERYVILDDLLERDVFQRAYDDDAVVRFFQRLRWVEWQRPVSVVRLSDLDWQRLASGREASMVANGGDIIVVRDSPGAGVMSRSPRGDQQLRTDLTQNEVLDLVRALRVDAGQFREGHPLRGQAEAFAQDLETELRNGRQTRVKEILQDILGFASDAASIWASTLSIFPR